MVKTRLQLHCENKSKKYLMPGMMTKEAGFQWSSAPRKANSREDSGLWYGLRCKDEFKLPDLPSVKVLS